MAGMVNREVSGDADGVSEDGAGDPEACGQGYESFDYLPPIQRLEKYALTQLYQRNLVGRVFLETLKSVADDPHDVASVFRILYNMSDNADPAIRMELMDHIPHIAMLCHSEKEKLLYVVDHLLPLVAKELTDPDAQVRKAAQITLLVLMDQSLVGQSAVEEVVCPVVHLLSESDQFPGCAVQLMSKMAPFLGRESTEKYFLARFCNLCHDLDMYVRKMCAAYFGEFCAVVGQPRTEEVLLSRFVDLCQDDVPGVRKACAEVIMSVSCACSLHRRKTVLAPMFVSLLWDSVRWVRSSAFKTLGPFISTFAVPSVADLVYNENGELVLVNREGCEFRLNPNSDRTADIDAEDDVTTRRRPQAEDNMGGHMRSFHRSFKNVESEEEEEDWGDVPSEVSNGNQESDLNVSSASLEASLQNENDKDNCIEEHLESSMSEVHVPSNLGELVIQSETEKETDGCVKDGDKQPSRSEVKPEAIVSQESNSGSLKSYFDSLEDAENKRTSPQNSPGSKAFIESWKKSMKISDAESESSSECITQETDLDDEGRTHLDDQWYSQGEDVNSSFSTPASTPTEEWDFNSFQYWKVPIPDLELPDTDVNKGFLDKSKSGSGENGTNSTVHPSEPGSSQGKSDYVSNDEMLSPPAAAPTHQQDIVPQELVELFVSMTNPPHGHMTDVEIALHCAFSLPAVALTLGRENWGFLRRTYEELAGDMQWKVRRTVACSIHELAEILGEELTAKDLVPIYNGLIKDLDEVRIGALKHLADFVKLLPSAEQKSFLTQFEMFLVTDTEWNWRFREELAQQLFKIIPLYSPQETCTHLVPVAICLLSDKVAAVRAVALVLVTGLINHVTVEGPLLRKLLPQLAQEFANSTRWERRQAFALLCSHLVSGRVLGGDQFAREVLPYLLDLSYDRVPNVRLAVARTLASDIMAHQFFSSEQSPHQEVLLQVLKRLNNDKDRDVRFFADPQRSSANPNQTQTC